MKKIVLILAILLLGGFLIVSIKYSQKSEQVPPSIKEQVIKNEEESITVDKILKDVQGIVKWEGDQYSRGTILWNTEKEELKLIPWQRIFQVSLEADEIIIYTGPE